MVVMISTGAGFLCHLDIFLLEILRTKSYALSSRVRVKEVLICVWSLRWTLICMYCCRQ